MEIIKCDVYTSCENFEELRRALSTIGKEHFPLESHVVVSTW